MFVSITTKTQIKVKKKPTLPKEQWVCKNFELCHSVTQRTHCYF